jgi:hypothetical protein
MVNTYLPIKYYYLSLEREYNDSNNKEFEVSM